jgi:DtxR family Mn-dependent transcriptional regulator
MTDKKTPTAAVEDFLKVAYTLQESLPNAQERVSTNALSDALGISAPSVTEMARRLHEDGYIDYMKYQGVRLTPEGVALALQVLRRHRLIELFLVQELGYPLHEVHEEAEKIEHAVSETFIHAIWVKLNKPAFDPHGDPIPNEDGQMLCPILHALTVVPLHQPSRVARFVTNDNAKLQYVLARGFKLQMPITVLAREPYEGMVTVELPHGTLNVGHGLAESILVEVL